MYKDKLIQTTASSRTWRQMEKNTISLEKKLKSLPWQRSQTETKINRINIVIIVYMFIFCYQKNRKYTELLQ